MLLIQGTWRGHNDAGESLTESQLEAARSHPRSWLYMVTPPVLIVMELLPVCGIWFYGLRELVLLLHQKKKKKELISQGQSHTG